MEKKIDRQLLLYIQSQINAQVDRKIISNNLIKVGWKEDKISEGFLAYDQGKIVKWHFLEKFLNVFKVIVLIIIIVYVVLFIYVNLTIKIPYDNSNVYIKQSLGNTRAEAEIIYNHNGNSYESVCENAKIKTLINHIKNLTGIKGLIELEDKSISAWNTTTCHDSDDSWVIISPLNHSTEDKPSMWCVDSNSKGIMTTNQIKSMETKCPIISPN